MCRNILAKLLAVVLLFTATAPYACAEEGLVIQNVSDPETLQLIQDTLYGEMESAFASDDYAIEDIRAVYISREYLEEVAFNSRANIYFGYTLAEVEEAFGEEKFVFTVGEDGQTTVKAFEAYDDTFDRIVRNLAEGGGVILTFVRIAVKIPGIGSRYLKVMFALGAAGGTLQGFQTAIKVGLFTAAVKGIETGDFDQTMKVSALAASEGFKWGAVAGSVEGAAIGGLTMVGL
ncbi:MAG: hypothetical protein E7317_00070 [Clostridiales bacterium]|nr:hypothetical protein [Clostridiales bacterium]